MRDGNLADSMALELDVPATGPSITTDDGFTIQVDTCGGFNLFAPGGQVFG